MWLPAVILLASAAPFIFAGSEWDGYVSGTLLGSGNIAKAAICGLDGVIWAKSDNFNIGADEVAAIAEAFGNQPSSLKFEGKAYMILRANAEQIQGREGSGGFVACKTNKAVIISLYTNAMSPERCAEVTQNFADFLKSSNY
ncbi:unnamed protein product, partial [Mesorhabditis spiculigera]